HGGIVRYLIALVLLGLTPMIKLTSAMIAAGALVGFLVERVFRLRRRAVPDVVLALTVPLAVTGIVCLLTLPSLSAFGVFVKTSLEEARGYSSAMSSDGNTLERFLAVQCLVLIGVLVIRVSMDQRELAIFLPLL